MDQDLSDGPRPFGAALFIRFVLHVGNLYSWRTRARLCGIIPAMKHLHTETYGERDDTPLEHAVDEHWDEGKDLLTHLPKKTGQTTTFFP